MPREKSLKTLFVETVMFISLFALMGHLSVNFWERYVIQTELSKMKTSLHSLKETINNIGIAYDHLHRELKDLAVIAEKQPMDSLSDAESKKRSSLTKQILQDIHIQAAIATNEMDIDATPATGEKDTQKYFYQDKENAATITNHAENKENKNIGPEILPVKNKMTHIGEFLNAKVSPIKKMHKIKNVSTITRYPLKTTAAGKGNSALHSNHKNIRYNNKQYSKHNIHKCYNDQDELFDTGYSLSKF